LQIKLYLCQFFGCAEAQINLLFFLKPVVKAVPWLRQLVAGLSPRRPGFDPGSVHVGFVPDKSGTETDFFPEYFGFPLSVSFTCAPLVGKTDKINNFHHRVAQKP
jgi:hypothetical protein